MVERSVKKKERQIERRRRYFVLVEDDINIIPKTKDSEKWRRNHSNCKIAFIFLKVGLILPIVTEDCRLLML